MSYALTDRQRELLVYLKTAPTATISQMGAALGLRGRGSVDQLLSRLEERGQLVRLRKRQPCFALLPWCISGRIVVTAGPSIWHVIHGPEHFERRAAENRRLWAQREAA